MSVLSEGGLVSVWYNDGCECVWSEGICVCVRVVHGPENRLIIMSNFFSICVIFPLKCL